MIDSFLKDLTHGARVLAKNPGVAFVAVLSIAIGVGANVATFGIAEALVLRPLPVPRAGEIVAVSAIAPRVGDAFSRQLSYPDYVDLRDRASTFDGLVAYQVTVAGFSPARAEVPQSTLGLAVSGNFFDVLQVQPAIGRFFLPAESQIPGSPATLVLSYGTWTREFGADPGVLNRHVRLGGVDFTVVGVAPESFGGMHVVLHPAYYLPITMLPSLRGMSSDILERRDQRGLDVRGRLKPGVSLEQANEEASLVARNLERAYPTTNRNYGLMVRTELDARLEERGTATTLVAMLMTLAFAVLLIACANVAGLLTSRAPAREREIALRRAIGGGRLRIARQLVTEGGLLAAAGGALGLALGYAVIAFFRRGPTLVSDLGVRLVFEPDRRALAVGVAVAAVTTLAASLVPAWRAARGAELTSALRGDGVATGRRQRVWGRNGLVTAQLALALVLLTVAVSLSRAFETELQAPGFRTTQLLLSTFEPALAGYDAERTRTFYKVLADRARTLPGVTSVGMTDAMPLNQDYRDSTTIVPEGFVLPPGRDGLNVPRSRIDEGYLATMEIPVLSGRAFSAADHSGTPRVVLVNQTMAERYWPGESPIGKRIRLVNYEGHPTAEIIGVTANGKYGWIGEAPTPWLYMPQAQDPVARSTLILAASGDAASLAPHLRNAVREIDSDMPIAGVRTIEDFYRGNASGLAATVVAVTGGMGAMGLGLATVGLYGLVAYGVARRTREIGIRMAVGARPASVLKLVLRQGLVLALAGALLGVAGSIAASGLVRAVFPAAARVDVTSYMIVVPVLMAVTLLATAVPARRAAGIDPLKALRQE